MIDFEVAPLTRYELRLTREFNEDTVRRLGRYYDEHEHDPIKEVDEIRARSLAIMAQAQELAAGRPGEKGGVSSVIVGEERNWGDPAVIITTSPAFVGNMVVGALGSPEQKERCAGQFVAFAITEPCCGSDTSSIQTTAMLDKETNEWVLNGTKIFITGGSICSQVVVWASVDRSLGRAAMKSFLVDANNPGLSVTKLENKLGFRASDTCVLVFDNCRIPYEDVIGDPEVKPKATTQSGFRGAMKTFDASRPIVAALALGVGQAALDFAKAKLEEAGYDFPYDRGVHELSAVQREVLEMEASLDAARMLIWRAGAMLDTGQRNSMEASMAKAKAGKVATVVTEKCVALLGPLGFSHDWAAEKFMRDCKVTDIFEGTGQINTLIVARNVLGFTREQLK